MEQEQFIHRLVSLRMDKGVSARDMSLSLGQSPGYMNNVENGVNFPSMTTFFCICEHLGIIPKEFFDTDDVAPVKVRELLDAAKKLNSEQIDHLIAIVRDMQRR